MTKPAPASIPRSRRKVFAAVPVVVGALLLAYATGPWSEDTTPVAAPQPDPAVARQEEPAAPVVLTALKLPVTEPRPVVPEPPHIAAPESPPRAGPPPEVVALATEDAKVQLEGLRPQMISRCSAASGSEASVPLVFHLTFDAQGREVARAIRGRRGLRGSGFTKCLRELEGTELSIPPPGTEVAVAVPVTFP